MPDLAGGDALEVADLMATVAGISTDEGKVAAVLDWCGASCADEAARPRLTTPARELGHALAAFFHATAEEVAHGPEAQPNCGRWHPPGWKVGDAGSHNEDYGAWEYTECGAEGWDGLEA